MALLPLIEELSKTAMSTKTKDQLLILIQREVKEDVIKVSEFKKLAGELLEDVRRRRGYIRELKKLKTNNDAIEMVELLQSMQKDDLEEAARLLLMANKTKLKMQNNSSFILKLRGHLVDNIVLGNQKDELVWRCKKGKESQFSVKQAYEDLRNQKDEVTWSRLVCFLQTFSEFYVINRCLGPWIRCSWLPEDFMKSCQR
ncbi:hypothetical protein Tco_1015179 [Tanacetum coccineum]|uniref:Uncharacterized protein n=1 Tax=Tanacetum coccineum TaxID=301880 RepID=A0ABQ5FKR4_9ASTR